MARYFYVTVKDAGRTGFLLGPFDTHQQALDLVRPAQDKAIKLQPWAHFYAYGTSSLETDKTPPVGILNKHFEIA